MSLIVASSLAAALVLAAPVADGGPGARVVAAVDAGMTADAAAPPPDAGPAPDETAPAEAAAEEPPSPSTEVPEDPALAKKAAEAAREMEELKAAEATVVDDGAKRATELFRAMRRVGPADPLHQRLQDVLGVGRALPIVPDQTEMEAASLAEIGSFDIEKAKKLYDIPVEMRPLVAEYIHFFQVPARMHFVKWIGRSFHYLPMMKKALREAGLPEDTIYLSMIESGFAPIAYSKAKAVGLWQFIEPTGKRFGLRVDFWEDERRDPVKSTYAAAAYLKELYTEFGDWRLAWAGYNAGAGMVRLAQQRSGSTDFWTQAEAKRAYRQETKHYVPKLIAAALIMKHLKFFGFAESEYEPDPPLEYEDAQVPEATDLDVIARAAGTTVDVLKDLNPSLRRWCTPPAHNPNDLYTIHLPAGSGERFAQEFPKIAPKDRMHFVVHLVGKGDTLSKIAERYGSVTEAIMRANGIKDSRFLKVKMELVVPVPRGGVASKEALVQTAHKQGFKAAPIEQEVPAEPPPPRKTKGGAVAGSVRTVQEAGKAKTIYGVAEGDSLWSISRKFNVKIAQLKEWNGFEAGPVKLRIGQEIAVFPGDPPADKPADKPAPAPAPVPAPTTPAPPAPATPAPPPTAVQASPTPAPAAPPIAAVVLPTPGKPVVYVVEQGDTLWSIAHKFKVTVEDLKKWNNLTKKKLKIGLQLTIEAK
jgi:membrane-bound lytic murein transglycosylase D